MVTSVNNNPAAIATAVPTRSIDGRLDLSGGMVFVGNPLRLSCAFILSGYLTLALPLIVAI